MKLLGTRSIYTFYLKDENLFYYCIHVCTFSMNSMMGQTVHSFWCNLLEECRICEFNLRQNCIVIYTATRIFRMFIIRNSKIAALNYTN